MDNPKKFFYENRLRSNLRCSTRVCECRYFIRVFRRGEKEGLNPIPYSDFCLAQKVKYKEFHEFLLFYRCVRFHPFNKSPS